MGFDLCVLGSSDHVVMTYGTFGMWGALLSSGHVIAAKGTNNVTYSEVISHYLQLLFTRYLQEDYVFLRSHLTNWTYMDTRRAEQPKLLLNIYEE